MPDERLDELGLEMRRRVPVSESPVLAQSPGVELAVAGYGGRVARAAGNVPYSLGLEGLDQSRLVEGDPIAVAEFAVLALAPREDLAVLGEGQGVLAARVHRDLLDDVLAEEGYGLGLADVVVVAEAETAVRALAAGVELALLAHEEQGFAAACDHGKYLVHLMILNLYAHGHL